MTKAYTAAMGAHYHQAIIAANPTKAAADLANALRGNDGLIAEARAQQATLSAFARSAGGIDRMKSRDFAAATHLQGLTEALAQL